MIADVELGQGQTSLPGASEERPRRRASDRVEELIAILRDDRARPAIAGTAYDTAWLASVPRPDHSRQPRYPLALQWLVDHQHSDGSWGGSLRYEHDRVVCTLASLIPLASFGRRQTDHERVQAGTRYLWQHGQHLAEEPVELVGFELLLPSLVRRAREAGLILPPSLDSYRVVEDEKLRLIPPDALYSPRSTVSHSLEFLGDRADRRALGRALGSNGAVGNSPAATAYYLNTTGDSRVVPYLDACFADDQGSVPVLHPCETFELLWSAYHLFLAGVPPRLLLSTAQREVLRAELQAGGVSLSSTFPIPDADDTAVSLVMLHAIDGQQDASVLKSFAQADGTFASFPYERHASVGVNTHILQAIRHVPGYPDAEKVADRLVRYLLDTQIVGQYWLDKWHISPLYATAHVLAVLGDNPGDRRGETAEAVRRSLEWFRQTQNPDGSWGYFNQPTLEETAYAVLALTRRGMQDADPGDRRRVSRALAYLREAGRDANPGATPLWIDKCLYAPHLIVRAVIDSAWISAARYLRQRGR